MLDKKLNILLFSWRGPGHPHAGGAEIVTHQHAKAWIKAGNSVTLFTSAFENTKEYEVIDGVNIIRRGGQILSVQWQAFWWYMTQNKEHFDLVVDQFHGLPFFTPLFVKTKKLAFIHEVTKDVWKYNPLSEPFHSIVSYLGQLGEPFIFKLLYKKTPFLTVSESTKNELIQYGIPSRNISLIHNGIGTIPQLKKSPRQAITFIGALAQDKGIEDALKVFGLLKDHFKKFWIIGKSDDRYINKLKKQVETLGISKQVVFWGYVSERKKFQLLAETLVIVNPSVREGWGLTVIEAASVGTPTIAYKVSGLQDAIVDGKTGMLANYKEPKNIADLILKLLRNKAAYRQMSKNAVRWANQFDWQDSTDKSLKLIKKITRHIASQGNSY